MKVDHAVALAAWLLLLGFRSDFLELSAGGQGAVSLGVVAASLLCVGHSSVLGVWSSGFWYILVLALFHLGMFIPLSFGYEISGEFGRYVSTWFGDSAVRDESIYLVTLATLTVCVAYLLAHRGSRSIPLTAKYQGGEDVIGAVLVTAGTAVVLGYIAVVDRSALFGLNRSSYWEGVASSGVDVVGAFVVTFGGVLLACARPSRVRRFGLGVLSVFGLWALSVGARTLIMYTVLAMVVATARLIRMPRARVAVVVVVGGLSVVSFVASFRMDGLSAADLGFSNANPMGGVVEMGGSIRPVIENVRHARVYDADPLNGATYVGWAMRMSESLLGLPVPDGLTDPRLAGNEFRGRIEGGYQIGYSAVSEAFLNWRGPGVLGVFGVIGVVLGRLDRWRLGDSMAAVYAGLIFYALAYHVRQPSIQVLPILAAGLILVLACRLLATPGGALARFSVASRRVGAGDSALGARQDN